MFTDIFRGDTSEVWESCFDGSHVDFTENGSVKDTWDTEAKSGFGEWERGSVYDISWSERDACFE